MADQPARAVSPTKPSAELRGSAGASDAHKTPQKKSFDQQGGQLLGCLPRGRATGKDTGKADVEASYDVTEHLISAEECAQKYGTAYYAKEPGLSNGLTQQEV